MNLRVLFFLAVAVAVAGFAQAQPPCLFNPSTGSYRLCHQLSDGGQCEQYGAACGASSQGMNTPGPHADQDCAHVTADGKCAHYGAPTAESGQCMFNPATGAYQTCLHATAGGECADFGAACK